MQLVRRVVTRKKEAIIARCEKCKREIEIPYSNTINPHMPSIDLKSVVKCECGEYHNLIIDDKEHRPITRTPTASQSSQNNDELIKCPRCRSTQLHTGDKGFGLGKAAAGGILLGPVGLLGGFLGRKKTMITCLKCGFKWQAGKA